MALKRKTRKAPRETSATQGPVRLEKSQVKRLIVKNGRLVEDLLSTEAWNTIALPLLSEMIAGVSGRNTNGRYYHGSLTRRDQDLNYLSGYQCALMDFSNRLHDFIISKDKLIESEKEARLESKAPYYNPFMEEFNEEADT